MTATTMSAVGELLARESWSRDELLAHQRRRLEALHAHAAAHSPYYREALAGGEPPVLTKQTLMDEWDRIVCDPRLTLAAVQAHTVAEPYLGEFEVFSTSGASGLRGLFVYGTHDWEAAVAPSTLRYGVRPPRTGAIAGISLAFSAAALLIAKSPVSGRLIVGPVAVAAFWSQGRPTPRGADTPLEIFIQRGSAPWRGGLRAFRGPARGPARCRAPTAVRPLLPESTARKIRP